MGMEIERKFLVQNTEWQASNPTGTPMRQGYLSVDPARTVRVRQIADQGFVTIKGPSVGAARAEFEYTIPGPDASAMLDTLALRPIIEKVRYLVEHQGNTWEVDVFEGDNAGLVVAELELDHAAQPFERPPWLGREVTDDHRYSNSSLVQRPYNTWPPADAG